jgi:hypothetical protein
MKPANASAPRPAAGRSCGGGSLDSLGASADLDRQRPAQRKGLNINKSGGQDAQYIFIFALE